jgi:hypothetical protein
LIAINHRNSAFTRKTPLNPFPLVQDGRNAIHRAIAPRHALFLVMFLDPQTNAPVIGLYRTGRENI